MLAFRTPQTGASHRMWDWLPATVTRAPHSQSGAKDAACGMVRFEHVSLAYIYFIYIYIETCWMGRQTQLNHGILLPAGKRESRKTLSQSQ